MTTEVERKQSMQLWHIENKLKLLIEDMAHMGVTVRGIIEAIEELQHLSPYRDTSLDSDITAPVILTYKQEQRLKELMKKDPRELR